MSRHLSTIGALAVVLTLGGCGDMGRKASTAKRQADTKQREITFASPALSGENVIPASYGCTNGIWLPLRWGALPPDTRELALYIGGFGSPRQISAGGTTWSPLIAESLVVGLKPTLHGLSVGGLPRGARLLSEGSTPSCPPRVAGRELVFKLFAVSGAQRISASSLHSKSPGELLNDLSRRALAVGVFRANYGGV